MSNVTQIRLNAAETALTERFAAAVGELAGNGDVTIARDRLFAEFRASGLPTRRREAWHYTDLKSLMRVAPANDGAPVKALSPLVEGAQVASLLNGAAHLASVPGLALSAYRDHLASGSAAAGLTALNADDVVGRLNGAFVTDGIVIDVPAGHQGDKPLELQAVHSSGQFHGRVVARFGEGSRLTVVERHQGGSAEALVSAVSEISLGADAEIVWILFQEQGLADTHLGQLRVTLGAGARLILYVVNAGGRLVRQDIAVEVNGEGSDFKLRGINLLAGESHADVTLMLGHNVPDTTSTEIVRNVVMDRAKGVFQGQIKVAQIAQKTDARMACNTLLLSDEADFSAKPELEIFADDVQCGHGATVADIDHTQLFYLQARGIPEGKARALLVNAFVAEIVEELEDEVLVEALESVISRWLETHGQ